jgi:hypothetical protein
MTRNDSKRYCDEDGAELYDWRYLYSSHANELPISSSALGTVILDGPYSRLRLRTRQPGSSGPTARVSLVGASLLTVKNGRR